MVDFSGYSPFWSLLLLQGRAATTSIWVHNDMKREVDQGDQAASGSTSGLCRRSSRCTTCSTTSCRPRRTSTGSRCAISGGSPRPMRSRSPATSSTSLASRTRRSGLWRRAVQRSSATLRALPRTSVRSRVFWAASPARTDGRPSRTRCARHKLRELYMPQIPGVIGFVSVGRLSPEKNHERLIRAFAKVHEDDPMTRLVIFGEGALRPHLEGLIRRLDLEAALCWPGTTTTPCRRSPRPTASCSPATTRVRGWSVLEAMSLGLPVVTCEFEVRLERRQP